jgi:hypothetical protein
MYRYSTGTGITLHKVNKAGFQSSTLASGAATLLESTGIRQKTNRIFKLVVSSSSLRLTVN